MKLLTTEHIKTYLTRRVNEALFLDGFPHLNSTWCLDFDLPENCEWEGLDFVNPDGELLQISNLGEVRVYDKNGVKIFNGKISYA